MCRIVLTIGLALLTCIAHADSMTQTDWSGGGAVWGPVSDWRITFYQETDIAWFEAPGCLMLRECVVDTINNYSPGLIFVHANDIDGDDDMDVLTAITSGINRVSWWENLDGSGTEWSQHVIDAYFSSMCVHSEDIDGDGDIDVLCAGDEYIHWWENINGSGTSWTEHTVGTGFQGANSVYSQDVDGDGDMDVLGAARYSDEIAWWENSDTSPGLFWTEHTVDGSFDDAISVHADDINGDGKMDILGAAYSASDITWWENMDGSGTAWMEHTVDDSFTGATCVFSEDLDSDGNMDILGVSMYTDEITWWENTDGLGTSWIEHAINVEFLGAHSVHAADMDGDGAIDILGAAYEAEDITWWENSDTSPGLFWTEHTVEEDFYYAVSLFPADIDGDSSLDILGGAHFACWWDLTSHRSEGSLESSILDTQGDPDWDYLDWNSLTPTGASTAFQVRASNNSTTMGAWSDTLQVPGSLEGILTDGDRYIQYRVILQTSDPDTTPALNDVTISWNPLSIEGTAEPFPQGPVLLRIAPNPTTESPVISFGLLESSLVDIGVFDLSGRLLDNVITGEYSSGYHNVQIHDLLPGIYFCRMISGDFTATQRFVVIK